ncbi:MAG: HupE/UreJ family protein [Rhodanobacteraceae bacterium]
MSHARFQLGALLIGLLLLVSLPAFAHKESDAYLTLRTDPSNAHALHGQWDIALRDLDFAIGIDSNRDGAITWGEVQAHRAQIERYALARLVIKGDGLTCEAQPTAQKIDEHTDGAYDVILFDSICDKEIPSRLTIVYRLFQDVDPYHRGIITIRNRGITVGAVLGPENPSTSLDVRKADRWGQFTSFVVDGIWHIWTGIDHLLFILSLLLPAVLIRRRIDKGDESDRVNRNGAQTQIARFSGGAIAAFRPNARYEWIAVSNWWLAFIDVVKIVSAFTLSHSVTLTLAVLGIVDLPSRLVESGIAISVIVAAGNNLYPIVRQRIWLIAFAFGFVHGLGFASALSGLQLPPLAMAASLGGFNVGVEIGQETIVLLVMPVAFLMRGTVFYQKYVLRWGSAIIIAMATGWLIQRAFDVLIPGFSAILPK